MRSSPDIERLLETILGSFEEAEHAFVTSAVDGTLLENRCVNYRD